MPQVLISLGANMFDKEMQLNRAIEALRAISTIEAQTPIYHTAAEGSVEAAPYANALLLVTIDADYETLRATFKRWEQQAGRTPQSKLRGEVPLDIDIVKWNDTLLKERDMQYDFMKQGLALLAK